MKKFIVPTANGNINVFANNESDAAAKVIGRGETINGRVIPFAGAKKNTPANESNESAPADEKKSESAPANEPPTTRNEKSNESAPANGEKSAPADEKKSESAPADEGNESTPANGEKSAPADESNESAPADEKKSEKKSEKKKSESAPTFAHTAAAAKKTAAWLAGVAGLCYNVSNALATHGRNAVEFSTLAVAYLMDTSNAKPADGEKKSDAAFLARVRRDAEHELLRRTGSDEELNELCGALSSKNKIFQLFRAYSVAYMNDNKLVIARRSVVARGVAGMNADTLNEWRNKSSYVETDVTLANGATARFFVKKSDGRNKLERNLREYREQRRNAFDALAVLPTYWYDEKSHNIITLVERTKADLTTLAPFLARAVYTSKHNGVTLADTLLHDTATLNADTIEEYDVRAAVRAVALNEKKKNEKKSAPADEKKSESAPANNEPPTTRNEKSNESAPADEKKSRGGWFSRIASMMF